MGNEGRVTDFGLDSAAIIPVVMAGVIGIYGFIIAVVVGTKSESAPELFRGEQRELGGGGRG